MTVVEGLDAYTVAPEPLEQATWLEGERQVWIPAGDSCVSVDAKQSTSGTLTMTACDATRPFFLVEVDADRARYQRVRPLMVVADGLHMRSERCTASSLRAIEEQDLAKAEGMPVGPPHAEIKDGRRTCSTADSYRVEELAIPIGPMTPRPPFTHIDWREAGRTNCLAPCPEDSWENIATEVGSQPWVRRGDAPIDVYETEEVCRAGPMEPSADVCTTLGAIVP